jgi:hypothetical protein
MSCSALHGMFSPACQPIVQMLHLSPHNLLTPRMQCQPSGHEGANDSYFSTEELTSQQLPIVMCVPNNTYLLGPSVNKLQLYYWRTIPEQPEPRHFYPTFTIHSILFQRT